MLPEPQLQTFVDNKWPLLGFQVWFSPFGWNKRHLLAYSALPWWNTRPEPNLSAAILLLLLGHHVKPCIASSAVYFTACNHCINTHQWDHKAKLIPCMKGNGTEHNIQHINASLQLWLSSIICSCSGGASLTSPLAVPALCCYHIVSDRSVMVSERQFSSRIRETALWLHRFQWD